MTLPTEYGADVSSGWTAWNGTDEITATTGNDRYRRGKFQQSGRQGWQNYGHSERRLSMRTAKAQIDGKEYLICFSTRVLMAIEEREGTETGPRGAS